MQHNTWSQVFMNNVTLFLYAKWLERDRICPKCHTEEGKRRADEAR